MMRSQRSDGADSMQLPQYPPALSPSVSASMSAHTALQLHSGSRPSFPLQAIFFAEFDNTVGPKITCQAPEGSAQTESRY